METTGPSLTLTLSGRLSYILILRSPGHYVLPTSFRLSCGGLWASILLLSSMLAIHPLLSLSKRTPSHVVQFFCVSWRHSICHILHGCKMTLHCIICAGSFVYQRCISEAKRYAHVYLLKHVILTICTVLFPR
jgi:hypothetical protein